MNGDCGPVVKSSYISAVMECNELGSERKNINISYVFSHLPSPHVIFTPHLETYPRGKTQTESSLSASHFDMVSLTGSRGHTWEPQSLLILL